MSNIWKNLERPIKVLAPMAGYTDSAFRTLCRKYGADVTITELVSADAVAHMHKHAQVECRKGKGESAFNKVMSSKNQPTADLLSFSDDERPLVVQLFGKHPENFAIATKWITENLKPDGIDINMGCPARKVVGSDHGAALIKYPKLAAEIVKAVKDNTDLPVSVKTRLGWDNKETILEFAPVLYSAGIDALIIHGRTYKQGFAGEADWDNIYKLKETLPELVVIGNGGIRSVEEGNKKMRFTLNSKPLTLDGFAIGQAAFGQPWIFSGKTLNKNELKDLILEHTKITLERKGDFGLIEFRKHILKYLSGFPGAKKLREQAVKIETYDDVESVISSL